MYHAQLVRLRVLFKTSSHACAGGNMVIALDVVQVLSIGWLRMSGQRTGEIKATSRSLRSMTVQLPPRHSSSRCDVQCIHSQTRAATERTCVSS